MTWELIESFSAPDAKLYYNSAKNQWKLVLLERCGLYAANVKWYASGNRAQQSLRNLHGNLKRFYRKPYETPRMIRMIRKKKEEKIEVKEAEPKVPPTQVQKRQPHETKIKTPPPPDEKPLPTTIVTRAQTTEVLPVVGEPMPAPEAREQVKLGTKIEPTQTVLAVGAFALFILILYFTLK